MAEKEEDKKSEAALREERVLEFWGKEKIFQKTLEKKSPEGEFIFYDGPPTANGMPGIHHLIPQSFKDAIPRYKTMRGYHVRRKGGWDTHGLPVELLVEKELGLKSKKEIESYGIALFNQKCKESVWKHVDVWYKFRDRVGYWVDKDNPYVTYRNEYIESLWNVVKKIDERKLLYKDYKVVPWCPRCGTALSSHELAQGYEDVKDLSIYAKFKIVGVENGYFLAWTTTPWTLPGNVALAVGKDITYVEVKVKKENQNEILVLAKDRLSVIDGAYEIVAEHKGSEMIGMQYEPLFDFFQKSISGGEKPARNASSIADAGGDKLANAYKVYAADFVNITDGTGIVHTAVMYGQDDFELGAKVGLPKFHLVNPEGKFVSGTGFLEGRFVKEKDISTDGKPGKPTLDVDIIKYLTEKNLFFKKENYEHSYPHCWRCHTALIYYARDSWYIRMSDPKIKKELISENKKIHWEPTHIRDGRFGEWLREIKDWAISRERYWGTPLPVWEAKDGEQIVVDSLETLKKYTKKSGNKYFIMRHGEADKNIKNISNSTDTNPSPLTDLGKKVAIKTAQKLKKEKIDYIFTSPLLRARQTAEIVAEILSISKDKIITQKELTEIGTGEFDGKSVDDYKKFFSSVEERFTKAPKWGETLLDVKRRTGDFIYEIEKSYSGKNVLIISHEDTIWMLESMASGLDKRQSIYSPSNTAIHMGELRLLSFVPIPHNDSYELDLHRPFIDKVVLEKNGKEYRRTKEVMDVWFDSGAMPYAQDHYPFENKKWVDGKGYPADYISEAIDQTRGWFYTLHAVGILMGRGKAFKNVICLGHLLDAKGKKMSKSLGNIVDPWTMMDKYGVDTLRLWMYSVNQPGESKNFDEKTIQLLHQQIFGLLYNVLAFHELYSASEHAEEQPKYKNILDQWIISRLNELNKLTTESVDKYKLLEPVRGLRDFVSDLSTWYLRRSRERIKEGDKDARETLYFVLKTVAQIMAPFAPFAAEDIWQKLKNNTDEESVHLCKWPKAGKIDSKILEGMSLVRNIVSLGLEARQKAKIQVRQPLSRLEVEDLNLKPEYIELIKDELNIKEVSASKEFKLITELTHELKEEGNYRELLRALQDMRKKLGLKPSEMISLLIGTNEEGQKLIQKFESDLKKVVLASKIEFRGNNGEEVKIDNLVFKVKVGKM